MEILKMITRASGRENYVDNAANYLLDDRCVMAQGYGVSSNNADSAALQFKQTAKFWNNQNKNQFVQAMLSFTPETAPTAEAAMALTGKIMQPLTEEHLALSVAHNEERSGSSYHTHTLFGTTNYNNGSMLYPDNPTNYALAQRAADVTGQPVILVVENDKKEEWECPRVFYPQTDDTED